MGTPPPQSFITPLTALRFGGSGNDNLKYIDCDFMPTDDGCEYVTPGCLNETHWTDLYGLAVASTSDFVFGMAYGLDEACSVGEEY